MKVQKSFTNSPNYKIVRIGDLLDFYQRSCELKKDVNYQLVTVKRRNEGIVSRGIFKGSDIKTPTQFYIQSGDFLISKRQIVHGACEIVPLQFDRAIVSNEYTIVRGKDGVILTEYFNLLSKTKTMKKYYFLSSYGVDIEKMVFNVEDWIKRTVSIPSIQEQEKVVEFFNIINKKIQFQREKIEFLKVQKKGLMHKIFNQELRFKNEVGKEFPQWTSKNLREIVVSKFKGNNADYIGDVAQGNILLHNEYLEFGKKPLYVKKPNDVSKDKILILWDGSQAGNVYFDKEGVLGSTFVAMKLISEVDYKFIGQQLQYYESTIKRSWREGSGIPHVSKNFIDKFKVKICCKEEQEKIAAFFEVYDKKIILEESKISELENQKQAFMQQMFI